ncbi:MAG: hypothetical protein GXP25_23490 [Planctomycetes bacterium]|nr:hypothetical protein [Planctomycetota bacterium]
MIVANRKDLNEIRTMLEPYSTVLVVGCGGCVSVCLTGGEEQAEQLATELKLAKKEDGSAWKTEFISHTRQCEAEFCEEIREKVEQADVVLSLACGCGVQLMADMYTPKAILPGMNTTFMGTNTAKGVWEETCSGCGDCVLAETGGICPITRCSKSLINGTCGGTTDDGKCEVSEKIECAWLLIYKRLKAIGRLDLYRKMRAPRDWGKQRSGGQRRLTHEHLVEKAAEDEQKESA